MNYYELSEIKKVRKNLDMTQTDLANAAGVSQSLIAKIESKKIDPTYSNTQKIFKTLDSLQQKEELKAKDIMQTKIVPCAPECLIKNVIHKMKRYEISQLPVMEKNVVVGLISEKAILEHVFNNPNRELKAKDIMQEVPPTISETTSETVVSNLLKFFPLIVITNKGKVKGIITKADLLRTIYK
jgi:predicted transcriptional regulator